MKTILEYINESIENNTKEFFKDWKKFLNNKAYPEELYKIADSWVEKYNLTLLDENNPEKPTNQPMMTLLLSKKKEHHLLDIAITRPGKTDELEGYGTINHIEGEWLDSIKAYDKWRKGYRGIITLQFAFPHTFFNKIRANLGDKLS